MRLSGHFHGRRNGSHCEKNAGILRCAQNDKSILQNVGLNSACNRKKDVRYSALGLRWAAALVCAMSGLATGAARAQQLIGYVATHDAEVVGAKDVMDGRAVLMGSASVTAKDHTAAIELARGGKVRVCQTSVLRLTESREMMVAAPLLFALDRGAMEVETKATPTDAVMTADLRFTVKTRGPLDLRLRVAANGDTCVENRGAMAPTLVVSDPFGDASYELTATQHVLFEHGSLREVVDHETAPCGCPEGMSVADALMASGGAGEKHPFPVAVSEGLAPGAELAQVGEAHAQISEALSYNAQAGAADSATGGNAPAAVAAPKKGLKHRVGRFWHRIFHWG
jgi:hypothetical protein